MAQVSVTGDATFVTVLHTPPPSPRGEPHAPPSPPELPEDDPLDPPELLLELLEPPLSELPELEPPLDPLELPELEPEPPEPDPLDDPAAESVEASSPPVAGVLELELHPSDPALATAMRVTIQLPCTRPFVVFMCRPSLPYCEAAGTPQVRAFYAIPIGSAGPCRESIAI